MDEYECPYCEADIEIPNDCAWGGEFDCPKCGGKCDVDWDYTDGEGCYYRNVIKAESGT